MTNQNQNGNEPYSAETRLREIEELNATYLESLKLTINLPNKADEYLNLDESDLKTYTAEDCSETAFKLSQYGLFIQKEINRHRSVQKWAESSILKIIASKVDGYGEQYTPFVVKRSMAIKENPIAKELLSIQMGAETNLTILEDVPRRIDSMAQNLRELSMVRRRQ